MSPILSLKYLSLITLGILATSGTAAPILLAKTIYHHGTMGSGLQNGNPPISFGYELSFTNDLPPGSLGLTGGGIFVEPDIIGSFEVDNSNSLNFNSVVEKLADNIDDKIFLSLVGRAPNGESAGGGGWEAFESNELGGLLSGRTIQYFILNISVNSLTVNENGYNHSLGFEWEVWGDGELVNNYPVVPEPTTLIGLLLILPLILLVSRKSDKLS